MDYREMWSEAKAITGQYPWTSQAQENVFDSFNRGKNIITPNLVSMLSLERGNHIVEVCWGTGMSEQYIFGVTVVTRCRDGMYRKNGDLAKLCGSLADLRSYLAELDRDVDEED